jgi:formiminoglutamase
MADDPKWPRAGAWLRGDHYPGPVGRLAVLGAPLHLGSITPGRCDLAPGAIRKALDRYGTFESDTGVDVRDLAVTDLGDVDCADARPEEAFTPLSDAVRSALQDSDVLVLLGGDNSITRPGCHGANASLESLGLLTLDAHHDIRDLDSGLSNGNPVRALLDDGLPGANIVQVGIAPFANSRTYGGIAREAGITVITIDDVRARGVNVVVEEALMRLSARADAIYVDFDIDVLDRAFAPGAPGSRPGGLTTPQLFRAARMCGEHPQVRVADLVELDPTGDVADLTALAAARCLVSFAAGVVGRQTQSTRNRGAQQRKDR